MEFSIGTRLKELRKAKSFSITELAEKSGVSTGLISQIERNLVVPSVVNLTALPRLWARISTTFSKAVNPGPPPLPGVVNTK